MSRKQTFLDKTFKDKNGQLALTAAPNLPIIIWAVALVAAKLIGHGALHTALSLIAFGAIIIWAVLEITSGVNYFRRVLGLVVLVFTLYNHLH